jgi:hypothetical protein
MTHGIFKQVPRTPVLEGKVEDEQPRTPMSAEARTRAVARRAMDIASTTPMPEEYSALKVCIFTRQRMQTGLSFALTDAHPSVERD